MQSNRNQSTVHCSSKILFPSLSKFEDTSVLWDKHWSLYFLPLWPTPTYLENNMLLYIILHPLPCKLKIWATTCLNHTKEILPFGMNKVRIIHYTFLYKSTVIPNLCINTHKSHKIQFFIYINQISTLSSEHLLYVHFNLELVLVNWLVRSHSLVKGIRSYLSRMACPATRRRC